MHRDGRSGRRRDGEGEERGIRREEEDLKMNKFCF